MICDIIEFTLMILHQNRQQYAEIVNVDGRIVNINIDSRIKITLQV